MARAHWLVSVALAALLLVGCGGGGDLPATHEVRVYPAGGDIYVLPSAVQPVALPDEDFWPALLWRGLDGRQVKSVFYPGTQFDIRQKVH